MNSSTNSKLKGQLIGFFEQAYKSNIFTYAVTDINGNLYENLVKINDKDII